MYIKQTLKMIMLTAVSLLTSTAAFAANADILYHQPYYIVSNSSGTALSFILLCILIALIYYMFKRKE